MPKGLKVKVSVEQKKLNLRETELLVKNNGSYQVDIGVTKEVNAPKLGYDGEQQGADLITVALSNEFGTDTVPQRSFLRAPFDEHQGYMKLHMSLLKRLANGAINIDSLMKILGAGVVNSFKKNIRTTIPPPNSPETLREKEETGSRIPLVGTGQLLEAITYRTKKG